jgi:prophage maintenance system killer protein
VVKNHSFTDGNKRIGAWLFVWYLAKNNCLLNSKGNPKVANNALATITLMVALSKPEEKELMVLVIVNSINKDN